MSKEALKAKVFAAIDNNAEKIIGIGEQIWKNPEPGYREFKTAKLAAEILKSLDLPTREGLGITGIRADLEFGKPGPTIAMLGELDSLVLPTHPECDPATGAVHACGHNASMAGMLGAAIGLVSAGISNELSGKIAFVAVPAEECIEIEKRLQMIAEKKISSLGGKGELIRQGVFDDVQLAFMLHAGGGLHLLVQGLGGHDVSGLAVDLQAVHVDDGAEVVQVILGSCHEGLPDLALFDLAVAQDGVDTVVLLVHLAGQSHANSSGDALTQRAGGHVNALDVVHLSVAGHVAVNAAEELQILLGEEAALCQDGIQSGGAVTLGQDETVPVRVCGVLGIHVHHVEVQNSQSVHGGERTAQVTGCTVIDHVQAQKPSLCCDDFQSFHICFHIVASSYAPHMFIIPFSLPRKFSLVNSLSRLAFLF